ncbi:uncharacterized protein MELLADRAFT_89035 [Melampsora larici-populina 98AG31]|uniref:Uncharacterized protein n=1 Tax=Melampsora larici-populina (strain 98AG31 / pathotype 3-4-7) TaxID=747676 RepID=F4R6R3_MELLP|nr:uncharacterized protein MELLADRAFT_89035 [Melampsora larici-populina 98AG31]EGG11920.1 hypothetical protein MELLADRAFT_89035 [Melampsora larici-populina 98AG31]
MDSNQFQDQIDMKLRNTQDGENDERGEIENDPPPQGTSDNTKEEGKEGEPSTVPSQEVNQPPQDLDSQPAKKQPKGKAKAKPVGPIRIKPLTRQQEQIKIAEEKEAEARAKLMDKRLANERAVQRIKELEQLLGERGDGEGKEERSDAEEDEEVENADVWGALEGNEGENLRCERNDRVVGGVVIEERPGTMQEMNLGMRKKRLEQFSARNASPEMNLGMGTDIWVTVLVVEPVALTATERLAKRMDKEIELAFRNHDRRLYDELVEAKREWKEFSKKKGSGGETQATSTAAEPKKKKKVQVDSGNSLTHVLTPLSGYWASVMSDLNRMMSTKSSRAKTKDADSHSYNGTPIPNEWRTTVAQWHRQKNLFIEYLLFYKQDDVAKAMKQHFENVLEIQSENEDGWMVAFRYDLEMRQAYMTFKVGPEEKMPDIGVRDVKVLKRAERETTRRGDDTYLDNPYAFGAVKAMIDPIDQENWEGRRGTWCDTSRNKAKEAKSEKVKATKATQSVRSTLWAQARHESHLPATTPSTFTSSTFQSTVPSTQAAPIPTGPAAERGGGNPYRGKNFIRNFNKRKADGVAGGSGWNGGAGTPKGGRDNGYGDRNPRK